MEKTNNEMIANRRKGDFDKPKALEDAQNDWNHIAINADKDEIKDEIYKGEYTDDDGNKRFEVRERLLEIYYDKCAYCEIKEFEPDVEHYRPKKRVTRESNHPGYYWLCYEWSNLIPSCRFCNTGRGKGNKFPVRGVRVSNPNIVGGVFDTERCKADQNPLVDEQPYLFHPEVDDPGQHFSFNRQGKVRGLDAEGRGEKTISICDLNRATLKYRRKQLLDSTVIRINEFLTLFLDGALNDHSLKQALKIIFDSLELSTQPDAEFSLMAINIRDRFDELVIPSLFEPTHRVVVSRAFTAYKNGTLV